MNKFKRTISLVLSAMIIAPLLAAVSTTASVKAADEAESLTLGQFVGSTYTYNNVTIGTSVYLPANYSPDNEYALLVYLHNAGGRGSGYRYDGAVTDALMKNVINLSDDNVIIFAPRCPADPYQWVQQKWEPGVYNYESTAVSKPMSAVISFIYDEIIAKYSVDTSRVYMSGDSMGGGGTWDIILREPDLFAAALPTAGYCDPLQAANIREDLAIWTSHTKQDKVVNVKGDRAMAATLKNLGRTNVRYTEYDTSIPEVKAKFNSSWNQSDYWEHYSWLPTHRDLEMIGWLLSHRKPEVLAPEVESKFTDITKTDVYYKAVNYVTEQGIFYGKSDTEFDPTSSMTREQFVTVLGRYAGVDTAEYTGVSFTDVDTVNGSWYAPYVEWATQNGIINGMGNGIFGVGKSITIEQACAILARFLDYKAAPNDTQLVLDNYSDKANIDDWATEAMQWAIANSVYMGKLANSSTLLPRNAAPRSTIATMLYNVTMIYGR